MDSEIPWLGPGIESADCTVRGKADPVFIKEKARVATDFERSATPALSHRH